MSLEYSMLYRGTRHEFFCQVEHLVGELYMGANIDCDLPSRAKGVVSSVWCGSQPSGDGPYVRRWFINFGVLLRLVIS